MSLFELRETDRLFYSEFVIEAGDPECLCSRCGLAIEERCAPAIRMWRDGEPGFEYRFHSHCLGAVPCCTNDVDDDHFDPDVDAKDDPDLANDFRRENPREELDA